MNRIDVTAKDLRRVQNMLDTDRPCDTDDLIAPSFLEDLATLVPCDQVTFQVMDHTRRAVRLQEAYGDDEDEDPELVDVFWDGFLECLACSYPQHTGDHTTVTKSSDFHSRSDLARLTMGRYLGAIGVRHEAMVPLPMLDTDDRRVMLWRDSGSDFTPREKLLLTLVRPHIIETHLRQERRRRGVPELTTRQWQILRLLAAGCSNRQIARALLISEATVRKHLENTYARLGVNSRTEALTKIPPLEQDLHAAHS